MRHRGSGLVPVLHAATKDRPDELDTIAAAEAVGASLERQGFSAEIVPLDLDLTRIQTVARSHPRVAYNLVDAINGNGRLAPLVPLMLEHVGIPFTGAGSAAWLATGSKLLTKRLLRAAGLPTPDWSEDGRGLDEGPRMLVKSVWEHGSLGIDAGSVVSPQAAAAEIAARAAHYRTPFFAEAYVEGREFNIGIIERPPTSTPVDSSCPGLTPASTLAAARGKDVDGRVKPGHDDSETARKVQVLPIQEILFGDSFATRPRIVDYDAKWEPATGAYVDTPRRFGLEDSDPSLASVLADQARACWCLFGLTGYARIDFRVDEAGNPWILEVNVNPCLTPDAGLAAAANAAGLSYDDLVRTILDASLSMGSEATTR